MVKYFYEFFIALFVDIIHTDAGVFGSDHSMGHVGELINDQNLTTTIFTDFDYQTFGRTVVRISLAAQRRRFLISL